MAAVVIVCTVALLAYTTFVRGGGDLLERDRRPEGPWFEASCTLPPDHLRRIERGTFPGRSPDLQFVPREPHFFGDFKNSTHSGPWDFLQEVPLVFYGPGYIASNGDLAVDREVTLADLAPTLADLLGMQWPEDRPGRAIDGVLIPRDQRAEPPRMIVLVVWDGGGWNVLERWPRAWPTLQRLMRGGTSVRDVIVGSSPSVTPAVHATMGTGAFPDMHGIVDIPVRDGDRVPDSFPDKSPKYLELETIADLYDPTTNNLSKVGMMAERGWHLGMMGHGAELDGGDRDYAVMSQGGEGRLITNPFFYRVPGYLNDVAGFEEDRGTVDASDGAVDDTWMGHPLSQEKEAGSANPVWTRYQLRVLEALWQREGFGRDAIPDLFFTNFKEIDLVGHAYNMISEEMREIVEHSDDVLRALIEGLDRHVGRNRWVVAVTADHGAGPDPRSVGAWPIEMERLQLDIAVEFAVRVGELFQAQRPNGMWFDLETLADKGIELEDIANFFVSYTMGDNFKEGRPPPRGYGDRRDEKLFSAAFPTDAISDVRRCVGDGS